MVKSNSNNGTLRNYI